MTTFQTCSNPGTTRFAYVPGPPLPPLRGSIGIAAVQTYTSSRIATIALKELAVGLAVVYIRDIDIERKGDRKTEIGRQNGNEA